MDKCPICGQNNVEVIFTKGNLDKDLINVICKNCGLVYVSPRRSREEYDNFHREKFLSEKSVVGIEQVKQKLNDSDFRIKMSIFNFLNEYLREGQNVLDIGCGFGVLLDILKKKKNINAFGVELGNVDIKAAKEFYGLDLSHESLEDFAKNSNNWGKFDVIILHHTLEHLPEPLVSLEQIKKLLGPEGILYVGVPNIMNLKKRPEIFFQTAHPFSYSPHSLKLMLEKAGFGIIKFNRSAGYPGGMETAAKTGARSADNINLEEGREFLEVARYIERSKDTFRRWRGLRDAFLFFMPESMRIKLGNIFYQVLKKGLSGRQFFEFIVLPSSIIAGFLFILRHIFIFITVTASGKIYNLFSLANIDSAIYYAPFVRSAFDGSRIVDGRILENSYLPNLWTQLSPILIAPLWRLTGSISFAFVLGHFLMAAGVFICFYLLSFYIIKNRIFSLLYSFVFVTVPLVFNYLFPISLDNLKLVGRTILPFGSPPGEALLSKYISFSVLPGFLFFVSAFLFIFLALNRKKKLFIILAGLNLGILTYIAITLFLYTGAALFSMLILFLAYKDRPSVKKILWIGAAAFLSSIIYWFNFLQIRTLSHGGEFFKRLGGDVSHQFKWDLWPAYMAYIAMVLFVLYLGKKYNKNRESIFVAGGILAAILVLNMQVVAGFNPEPAVWWYHQLYLGFALGWLVIVYWLYAFLLKKFNKRIIAGLFLAMFLMIIGRFIYTERYAADILSKYEYMPKEIYDSLEWLNKNTEKDTVVATPSLVTNAYLPVFTHNNSMLPTALTSPLSLADIKDRYLLTYKLFNVSADYVKKALMADLPAGSENTENNLWEYLVLDYYCDQSLGAYLTPGYCLTPAAQNGKNVFLKEYGEYPEKRGYLLNKYKIDYLYYGPHEKKISQPNLDGFEKIYDKDEIEIYKRKTAL